MGLLQRMPCWLLIVLAVLIIIFIFNVPESSAEWAAWVQALGTILAIGSGFALHFWKARAAELRTLLQIERALNQVTEELNRSIDDADENGEVGINYSKLRQLAVFLDHKANDIDLGFAVITAVADLSHIVRETYDRMEAAKLGGELRPLIGAVIDALDLEGNLKRRVDLALTSVKKQRGEIENLSMFEYWNRPAD